MGDSIDNILLKWNHPVGAFMSKKFQFVIGRKSDKFKI
jgi:hypothetical protein